VEKASLGPDNKDQGNMEISGAERSEGDETPNPKNFPRDLHHVSVRSVIVTVYALMNLLKRDARRDFM
jgi:hypothetical protein